MSKSLQYNKIVSKCEKIRLNKYTKVIRTLKGARILECAGGDAGGAFAATSPPPTTSDFFSEVR